MIANGAMTSSNNDDKDAVLPDQQVLLEMKQVLFQETGPLAKKCLSLACQRVATPLYFDCLNTLHNAK